MARALRVDVAGAWYDVMNRGIGMKRGIWTTRIGSGCWARWRALLAREGVSGPVQSGAGGTVSPFKSGAERRAALQAYTEEPIRQGGGESLGRIGGRSGAGREGVCAPGAGGTKGERGGAPVRRF